MTKKDCMLFQTDEDYIPSNKVKCIKLKRRKDKNSTGFSINSNKWTSEQNKNFLKFVKDNKELLLCPNRRKQQKVFLQLSKMVQTRSPDQCRSHHQKMIKHHNDLDGIITHLENKFFKLDAQVKIQEEISLQYQLFQTSEKDKQISSFNTCTQFEVKEEAQCDEQLWNIIQNNAWVEK